MGISAISTATGSTLIPSNDATASTTVATPQSKSAASDTVSISDAAINAFEKSLRQVNNQINSYEHQVTWRLDHLLAGDRPEWN
jgi:conjugal transfer/entry exclusion protein